MEETLISSSEDTDENNLKKCFKSIRDIPESWLADHANDVSIQFYFRNQPKYFSCVIFQIKVTRMLPGGMRILGIFLAGPEDTLDNNANVHKFRSILLTIQRNFLLNKYLHGNNQHNFILTYNSITQR